MTRKQLEGELGAPRGEGGGGKLLLLFYDGGTFELTNGRVSSIPENFSSKRKKGKKARAFGEKQKKKGLIFFRNAWMTPEARDEALKKESTAGKPRPFGSRKKGHPLAQYGKVTIVDFYADWCGPCKRIAPGLAKISSSNSGVVLKKVDIKNFKSDVAKKYNIRSIASVWVFDKQGKQVGSPTSSLSAVNKNVKAAL